MRIDGDDDDDDVVAVVVAAVVGCCCGNLCVVTGSMLQSCNFIQNNDRFNTFCFSVLFRLSGFIHSERIQSLLVIG